MLLLGVGHASNTSLHLAEYRASYPDRRVVENWAPMRVNGQREWARLQDIDLDSSDFEQIGTAFELASGSFHRGKVAQGRTVSSFRPMSISLSRFFVSPTLPAVTADSPLLPSAYHSYQLRFG